MVWLTVRKTSSLKTCTSSWRSLLALYRLKNNMEITLLNQVGKIVFSNSLTLASIACTIRLTGGREISLKCAMSSANGLAMNLRGTIVNLFLSNPRFIGGRIPMLAPIKKADSKSLITIGLALMRRLLSLSRTSTRSRSQCLLQVTINCVHKEELKLHVIS